MGNSATRSAERASPIGGGGDAAANAPVSDYKPVLGTRGLPTLAELMAFRRAEAEREVTKGFDGSLALLPSLCFLCPFQFWTPNSACMLLLFTP